MPESEQVLKQKQSFKTLIEDRMLVRKDQLNSIILRFGNHKLLNLYVGTSSIISGLLS